MHAIAFISRYNKRREKQFKGDFKESSQPFFAIGIPIYFLIWLIFHSEERKKTEEFVTDQEIYLSSLKETF